MSIWENDNNDGLDLNELEELNELKELIENDFERFELPPSLKSENLMHLLDDVDNEQAENTENAVAPAKNNKVIWLKWASAAACFALVFFGWSSYQQNAAESDMAMAAPAAAPAAEAPMETMLSLKAYDTAAADEETSAESGATASMTMAEPEEAEVEIEYPEQPAAKSYDEIFAAIEKVAPQIIRTNPSAGSGFYTAVNDAVPESAAVEAPIMMAAPKTTAAPAASEPAGGAVYQTNTQVKGVDESDIVKTDGRYIYHYHFDLESGGAQVSIFGASNLSLLSTIELPDYSDAEMYVSGDRLVIVQQVDSDTAKTLSERLQMPMSEQLSGGEIADADVIIPDYYEKKEFYTTDFTEAVIYDISEHKAPKEVHRFRQEGTYVSSRLSENSLYLITNKRANGGGSEMPIIRYIPSAGNNDDVMPLGAECILLPPYIEKPNYAVVSSLDIMNGSSDTKAVLGMVDEIMMSKNSLFLTATVYGENRNYYDRATGISRFDVTDGGLKYLASGKVSGYIDDQFSLDEYNGMLRIATTSYNEQRNTVNNLFVLDQKLEPVGEVTGLAEDERIYSVRFMGETAYVVTFKETDPLFVIDLSDPAKPVVKGELKIPGFSEYLHPIDENTLVGLGINTYVNHNGVVIEDGLKLSLFDVSDPTDPKESASYLIGNTGSDSEALNNHKAFMYYPEKKLIGFPATIYTSYGATSARPRSGERKMTFGGYLVVEISDSGFGVVGSIPDGGTESLDGFMRNDLDQAIERGIYIGNTLYTFAQSKIMAFSIDDFTQIGEYKYK